MRRGMTISHARILIALADIAGTNKLFHTAVHTGEPQMVTQSLNKPILSGMSHGSMIPYKRVMDQVLGYNNSPLFFVLASD